MDIELVDETAVNRHEVGHPHPDQQRFVAPTMYYLCLCHYGGQWNRQRPRPPIPVRNEVAERAVLRD